MKIKDILHQLGTPCKWIYRHIIDEENQRIFGLNQRVFRLIIMRHLLITALYLFVDEIVTIYYKSIFISSMLVVLQIQICLKLGAIILRQIQVRTDSTTDPNYR